MSFFNKLFHGKKQNESLEKNPKENQSENLQESSDEIPAESDTQDDVQASASASAISTQADTPLPFGYKTGWLAIKGGTPEQVIDTLQLKNKTVANWKSGMKMAVSEGKVFVSPLIEGYVLLIGPMELELEQLGEMAKNFEELQYFVSHRVVELHSWTLFQAGELVRHYYYIGESGEVVSVGELTEEEKDLGFDSLIMSEDDDWDEVEFPDEESVLEIAAAWGVDTSMQEHQEEKSTGYVCDGIA